MVLPGLREALTEASTQQDCHSGGDTAVGVECVWLVGGLSARGHDPAAGTSARRAKLVLDLGGVQ